MSADMCVYCIGRKLRCFVAIHESFLHEIWVCVCWQHKQTLTNVFVVKLYFPSIGESFISLYG